MELDGLDLVRRRFNTFSHLRLLSSDPLSHSESNRFCVHAAYSALTNMRQKYYDETRNTLLRWELVHETYAWTVEKCITFTAKAFNGEDLIP